MIKKIIIFLLISLLFLIVITIIITNSFKIKNKSSNDKTIYPTIVVDYNQGKNSQINTTQTNNQTQIAGLGSKITKSIFIIPKKDQDIINQLKSKLPLNTADFAIVYSPIFNKFIVQKKTSLANEKFNKWMEDNKIDQILKNNNLIIYTPNNQSAENYKKVIETELIQKNELTINITSTPAQTNKSTQNNEKNTNLTNNTSSSDINSSDQQIQLFKDFIKLLFSINFASGSSDLSIPVKIPNSISPTHPVIASIPLTLNNLFNEVGTKVGVPSKILEAVLTIESPDIFNLSSEEISLYSTPGNSLPNCRPNECSAIGPMQMTIGVDDTGNTSCPRCGAGYCPNAWSSYGSSVNNFGGYNYQSNPCNIKDSIYGAAAKLKNDSGANDPINWTQEQVFDAALHFYGNCNNDHRYDRLGGKTYCEYVWWYYNPSSNNSSDSLNNVLYWAENINNNLEKGVYEGLYNRLTNPLSNNNYTAKTKDGTSAEDSYWCTNLIIDSYNLAGINGLSENLKSVVNMRQYWMNNNSYKLINYMNADSNLRHQILTEVKPGCVMFFESNPGIYTGNEHASIIKSISIDNNGQGTIQTLDANSTKKTIYYSIDNNNVINTPYQLTGFGCI